MANTAEPAKTRVAIYIRVSTNYQADKDSLPMQEKDLVAYSKLILGTDDYRIFRDAGYSGKNTDRPAFQEMMSQVRSGLFTHVLVWKIDRISRNLLDFSAMYKELKDLGVTFVSKNENFDTSTAMGEAMLKIVLVFAELERNMTSERVTATMVSRASNGQWNGGHIPFGYSWDPGRKEFSVSQEEAAVVKLIFDEYESVRSIISISRDLNRKGLRTRLGNFWSAASVHHILTSPFYIGDYLYNVHKDERHNKFKDQSEWVTIEAHHDPIISRDQFDRVQKTLNAGRRLRIVSGKKHIHIFGGLLMCKECGEFMYSAPESRSSGSSSRYNCYRLRYSKSPKCKSVGDAAIGDFVFNYILNMLNAQKHFSEIHSRQELQYRLLIGSTFKDIASINDDGLEDLYCFLKEGNVSGPVFGKGSGIKSRVMDDEDRQISTMKAEREKLIRAADRLTDLYLFDSSAMSEQEFITRKARITEQISEIDDEIGFLKSDGTEDSISDDIFVQRASEFIIAQKLTDRNFVYFKNLAASVDHEVLRAFVLSVINKIVIDEGRIRQIVFKNGLSHTFAFRGEP